MTYFKTDDHFTSGLVLVILSTLSICLGLFLDEPFSDHFMVLFFVQYGLAIIYCVLLKTYLGTDFWSLFNSKTYSCHLILLVLFNISAFSLNKGITVFSESAEWLTILIIFENVLLLLIAIIKKTPLWLKILFFIMLPVLLLFHVHQIIITLPMLVFGLLGSLFVGIGLLLFMPFFYLIALVRTASMFHFTRRHLALGMPSFVLLLGIISHHIQVWQNINDRTGLNNLEVNTPFYRSELPDWVTAAQNLKNDHLTETYLKADIIYQRYEDFGFSGPRFGSFDEKKIHDPIITLTMALTSGPSLDRKSRVNILKFLFDKRHQTAAKFWRSDHLTTDQVVTNVEVFPNERLSYSELILSIANNNQERWGLQEEAIYTFQLPEGGVITSLSLWIDGNEEKGILTTKSKAEKAYNTIVGKEMRDPSVVYWMEGNKARIRVFPCTPSEKRKFKVGITAPLKLTGEMLRYQPITFEGPDYSNAAAAINLVTNSAKISSDLSFNQRDGFISWVGNYQPKWTFELDQVIALPQSFTYNGATYASGPTSKKLHAFSPKYVYLDVTNNWSPEELLEVKSLFSNQKVITLKGPQQLTLMEEYPNFTLFPYHDISSPEKSIVITKGGINTPNLEDLKDSKFRDRLFTYFSQSDQPPIVLDLGTSPSSYHQSLKEFGVISHHTITLKDLKRFATSSTFPDPIFNPEVVDIANNGISIEKTANPNNGQGSDHLMRLFYYQSIMNQIGRRYFTSEEKNYIEDDLTTSASIANVVTPLSSLIVLESQKDYERFEIEKNKNSLGNASINDQGAVPEPHEWALIIVGAIFIVSMYLRKGLLF